MSHMHLSHYKLAVAQCTLLRAYEWLQARPEVEEERLQVLGHRKGDMLMTVVGWVHGGPRLLQGITPGMVEVLEGRPSCLGDINATEDEAAASEVVRQHEASVVTACHEAVSASEAQIEQRACTRMHTHAHACTRMHTHARFHMHACTRGCIRTCMHTYR